MKTRLAGAAGLILLALTFTAARAQVPQLVNYQGRVAVGTTNFNGSGTFKFALVNAAERRPIGAMTTRALPKRPPNCNAVVAIGYNPSQSDGPRTSWKSQARA